MSLLTMTRIDELQADRAIWGLDAARASELHDALQAAGQQPDESWERAAALATLALQGQCPSAPSPALIDTLRASAPAHLPGHTRTRGRVHFLNSLLAAAVFTLSVLLWWDRPTDRVVDLGERRAELQARGATVWEWQTGSSHGDVVWDGTAQQGFLRFRDLPANDPARTQYQLWIVDGKRNPAHPVDGGVFDVPAGRSEVIVPVDPKLLVHDAQAFVVTVESPGGVVVSDRKQIVALAKPQ